MLCVDQSWAAKTQPATSVLLGPDKVHSHYLETHTITHIYKLTKIQILSVKFVYVGGKNGVYLQAGLNLQKLYCFKPTFEFLSVSKPYCSYLKNKSKFVCF